MITKYTVEVKREVEITTQDIIDSVLCCEAGGFDYWAEICFEPDDYTAAKERLLLTRNPESICYEDVLMEILEHGGPDGTPGKLTVYDREEDEDHDLTTEMLLEGWKQHIECDGRADFDDYDANDADCILQYAVFGVLTYG